MSPDPENTEALKNPQHAGTLSVGKRIRELRTQRSLTLEALSKKCGISVSSLSRIENTRLSLNLEKIQSLAKALDVPPEVLVGMPGTSRMTETQDRAPRMAVDRRRERTAAVREGEVTLQHLFTEVGNRCLDCVYLEVDPISIWESEFVSHPGEKAVYVLEGEAVMYIRERPPTVLEAGDALFMDGNQWHSIVATNDAPARVLVVYCTGSTTLTGDFESRFFNARQWADLSA